MITNISIVSVFVKDVDESKRFYTDRVEFLQPPSQRPYGTEALCRDNSGNWLVLVQPTDQPVTASDFE